MSSSNTCATAGTCRLDPKTGAPFVRGALEYMKPSEWARLRYEEALERGDAASAQAYLSMHELWVRREQETKKGG